MDLSSALGIILFFLWICTGENCTDFNPEGAVLSVPEEVAMLKSSLLSSEVLNFRAVPYNITWMNSKTGQEMSNQTGQILVLGATLWFLNTTLGDAGEYVIILRNSSHCYKQSVELVVDRSAAGEPGNLNKYKWELTNGVSDVLNCPLEHYINTLRSYNIPSYIKWYSKGVLIPVGRNENTYMRETELRITRTKTEHSGFYTCTLTFTLDGVTRSVSETIEVTVKEEYSWIPQVHKPTNEAVKTKKGSKFIRQCLVFVPGGEKPFESVFWTIKNNLRLDTNCSARICMTEKRMWRQDTPTGWFIEKQLIFSELKEEDFHINYTCQVKSARGRYSGYFTLLKEDPNNILPITLYFGSAIVLCVISVIVYYVFKIDIVLCFRRTFSAFYTNKDLDGKLYDAYVTYPQPDTVGFSEEVERFALCTLPEVLEKACGYKLFITGRDCLPGQAIMDSVDENIKSSRRVLLLYTASTFISHRHTSSNISKNNDYKTESKSSDSSSMGLDGGDKVFSDTRQQLECVIAMHRALLEGSLKVVLVELEEITPAQLALFPESVRHLRKKQGTVCWWKNLQKTQRRGTCVRWRRDEEKDGKDSNLSPSLCPSSRFWKEMRYHMPVRGKRVVSAEKTALLNL